jgi:hypothetical protein
MLRNDELACGPLFEPLEPRTLLSAALPTVAAGLAGHLGPCTFTVLADAPFCGEKSCGHCVIYDEANLAALWASVAPGSQEPTVDFNQYTVVAVFQGQCTVMGSDVRVERVTETRSSINVRVMEYQPAARGIQPLIVTEPFQILTIPRTDKPIVFDTHVYRAAPARPVPAVTNPTPVGFTPSQIRQAYGFSQVTFSAGTVAGNGTGQTIAIVDACHDPNITADVQFFSTTFSLPTVDGTGQPLLSVHQMSTWTATNAGWALETALDAEWAHAVAPGAHLLLVEARSSSLTDLLSAVSYAGSQSGVVSVSMSWGSGEFSTEARYDTYFTTPAGHVGGSSLPGSVSFVAAAGDSGGITTWPAVSPNVLSVGGTTLQATPAYVSESAWSSGGGGISLYEPKPSYQAGVTFSATRRTNPDVAYDADPATGFAVYDTVAYGSQTGWFDVGGTSAGAPQWAALVAIADQGRALSGHGSLNGTSQTLPTIYSLPQAAFHDVISGSNSFPAGPGYDLATGRGSPIAPAVISGLLTA